MFLLLVPFYCLLVSQGSPLFYSFLAIFLDLGLLYFHAAISLSLFFGDGTRAGRGKRDGAGGVVQSRGLRGSSEGGGGGKARITAKPGNGPFCPSANASGRKDVRPAVSASARTTSSSQAVGRECITALLRRNVPRSLVPRPPKNAPVYRAEAAVYVCIHRSERRCIDTSWPK